MLSLQVTNSKSTMVFVTLLALISNVLSADSKCLKVNTTSGDCLMCSGSYWDATAKVCTVPTTLISGAFNYTNATTVDTCKTGFYKSNNTCVAIPQTNIGCANGSATSAGVFTCSACTTGKYLSLWGQCVAIPSTNTNCTNGSATTAGVFTCSACGNGYVLTSGSCVAIATSFTNCSQLNTAGTQCTKCTNGYAIASTPTTCTVMSGAEAVNCQTGTVGSSATTCTACLDGFFINTANSNNCSAVPSANTNCKTGTGSTSAFTCTACNSGFYLNSSVACVAVPSVAMNCSTGTVDTSGNFACTGCASGFSLITTANSSNNTTTYSCLANSTTNCTVANCTSCLTSTTCFTCASTYTLVLGTSPAADTCVVGVAECYQGTATACTICNPGFYINSGKCTAGIVTLFGKILSLLLVFILQ